MAEIVIGSSLLFGIISLIFGFIVLAFPKILNYLVAFYLIIIGLLTIITAL